MTPFAYYNENDPKTAAWLSELIRCKLIMDGIVDTRSITEVRAADVEDFTQCHFFAGIGGWSYALRLAGWPDDRPVWTGSCPCQPSSSAARGRLVATELWPEWFRLITQCCPGEILGEQVVRGRWLDSVVADLESVGYTVGAAILPALCVNQDHRRERIYFAGYSDRHRQPELSLHAKVARMSRGDGLATRMVPTDGVSERMAALSGFGNAIVPQVAAAFIEAYVAVVHNP